MNDNFVRPPQWTLRLSTIPSESERNSQSVDGSGRRSGSQNYGGNGGRRRTISSMISSEGSGVWTGSSETGSIPMPPPLFVNNRALPPLPPPGRDSEEGDDTLGELHSPPLRQQRSGFLQRIRSRPTSADSINSEISFVGDLSWARNYYRHGDPRSPYYFTSSSESRLNTGTEGRSDSPTSEAFPAHIYRPRNRPFNANGRRESTIDSMVIEEGTPRHSGVRGAVLRPMRSIQDSLREMWSPHLHRDRRSNVVHYGAWRAPSFDEPFWSRFFGPVNRQVWLFCIGFVFPLGKCKLLHDFSDLVANEWNSLDTGRSPPASEKTTFSGWNGKSNGDRGDHGACVSSKQLRCERRRNRRTKVPKSTMVAYLEPNYDCACSSRYGGGGK
jgi:hypothetical protein